MDFQSAMETFAEAWVAANSKACPLGDLSVQIFDQSRRWENQMHPQTGNYQSQALALTRNCKSPSTGGAPAVCQSRCDSREQSEATHTPAPSMSVTPHVDTESMVSPPSVKDGFDKTSSGKSLPVHCVVESINSLEETKATHSQHWRRRSVVETDSFVIIPINTPFQELVQAALQRLGYPSESVSSAKGSLVMKNWKPLSFEQITDDPVITVGEILGELTTVATLKIQMYRARPTAMADIKDKLLKLLLVQCQGRLLSTGCPLDEILLSHICRSDGLSNSGQHIPELSEDCRRKFDQWWASQINTQHVHSALYSMAQAQAQAQVTKSLEPRPAALEHVHPAMQTVQSQYPTQKTRMRTSFDPELELPKLQRWFTDNQHPSRQQIQQYVKELNSLESRRGRKPLDVNNVVYWFKNARAAQKRAEVRNMSPGIPCHLSANGYNSGSHSPPNGSSLLAANDRYGPLKSPPPGIYDRNPHANILSEEISMPDSELEDDEPVDGQQRTDDEQPLSPTAPLSLTTNRKREDSNNSPLPTTPPQDQQSLVELKVEPADEPVNLHSPSDLSNNNKMKNHVSDGEDEDPNEKEREGDKRAEDGDAVNSARLEDMSRQQLNRLCSPTSDQENSQLIPRGSGAQTAPGPDNLDRLAAGFPLVPNSMFSHSIMYMSHYIPGLTHGHGNMTGTPPPSSSGLNMSSLAASAADERRKRNRTFIDPVTEVPRLEQWFSLNTHPSHSLILKYTEELNCMTYRQKFPRLEPKNVQFWFKNRRAKCKRLKMSLFDNQAPPGQYHQDRE